MTVRKTLFFPLEGTLPQDIEAMLALSDGRGQPLPGKNQEWVDAVKKVIRGMKVALLNDGTMEV